MRKRLYILLFMNCFLMCLPHSADGAIRSQKTRYTFVETIEGDSRVVPMAIESRQEIKNASKNIVYDIKSIGNIIEDHNAYLLDSIFCFYINRMKFTSYPAYSTTIYSYEYNPTKYLEFYAFQNGIDQFKFAIYIDENHELFQTSIIRDNIVLVTDIFKIGYGDLEIILGILSNNENSTMLKKNIMVSYYEQSPDYFLKINGSRINEVIEKGILTKVMLLDPEIKNAGNCCQQYSIISEVDSIADDASRSFSAILLNGNNYSQSGLMKRAYFLPDYACMYKLNDDVVYVLVALYCDSIRVYDGTEYKSMDIGPGHAQFESFIKMMFPNKASF